MNDAKNPTPDPTDPDNSAWEEAMSRDFDARVRDLHEAPLDFDSVKGKARTIRRNRRAAVAGGVLGVAAVITPIAVVVGGNADTNSDKPDFANPSPTAAETSDPTITTPADVAPDYVVQGEWHQADGDEIELPRKDYSAAVLWDGQLVATYFGGEVFSVADVIDEDGEVVDSFDTTAPVVVNDSGTTIAWVGTDGQVMTRWADDQVSLGEVDLDASGEGIAYSAAAVTGGPSCYEAEDGCMVYVDSGDGQPQVFDSHGVNDNPVPDAVDFGDASDTGLVTYRDEINDTGSCGGLIDLGRTDATPVWEGCEIEAGPIAPDGQHVIGLPAYYDGLGLSEITVRDARTGAETGRFAPEGGFVGSWAWSTDGRVILDAYDGANWHLFALSTDGALEEIAEQVKGPDFDSPFTMVQH
ncbi:hypothetical protein DJ010_03610 [Nocardioides silvaticus]|uniref:WD40 repeat domain-containing protein n=1 Tax=Nocardioides silvaticus TaxID=2201891 RepID=A0A316TR34_9ACTN|nr:hypothetical protein [Nocardioides silvaticus]PWN04714.1 hypothetical protein DJ010_03610 [Nocardioides silvaticus]